MGKRPELQLAIGLVLDTLRSGRWLGTDELVALGAAQGIEGGDVLQALLHLVGSQHVRWRRVPPAALEWAQIPRHVVGAHDEARR